MDGAIGPSLPPAIEQRVLERERLERELVTLWGHINAASYRFLQRLAEFDRNEYWGGAGIRSCAHWLNVFCGIGTVAAREKVRVARALEDLPLISESFRLGEISYSKVRAMTRVATPAIEEALLDIARHGTASHMARLVRHFRAIERREESEQAEEVQRARYLRTFYDDDGSLVLTAKLPPEAGAIVVQAIEAVMALDEAARRKASKDAPAEAPASETAPSSTTSENAGTENASEVPKVTETPWDPVGARRADALRRISEEFLAEASRNTSSPERYQVVVHIDQALLAGTSDPNDPLQLCELEDGPRLAVETARRLACDSHLIGLVESDDGEPLNIGRKTRAIPLPLKRALKARDRGCRFPGCERTRYTEGHHIEHWADGGETKPENLVTLCDYHHRLLHEGGFGVIHETGELTFTRPDGRPLLEAPGRFPGSAADGDRDTRDLVALNTALGLSIDEHTARTRWIGERMDYSQALEWLHFRKYGPS